MVCFFYFGVGVCFLDVEDFVKGGGGVVVDVEDGGFLVGGVGVWLGVLVVVVVGGGGGVGCCVGVGGVVVGGGVGGFGFGYGCFWDCGGVEVVVVVV